MGILIILEIPTASLRCEAGVFLSMLILLPSTYNSRSAWEFSEQTANQPTLQAGAEPNLFELCRAARRKRAKGS